MKRWWAMAAALLIAAAPTADWSYSYPAQVRSYPALKARLDRAAAKRKAEFLAEFAAAKRDAAKGGFPLPGYAESHDWKVVTDTPRYLGLSADIYEFSGGAHGNSASDALVWDKAAGRVRPALGFFTGRAALLAAIRQPFCAGLNRQRAEKRGEPIKPNSRDPFDTCPDPTGETLLLGSSDRRRFDRIGVLMPPYEAGPYAEGGYEVTLPVTPAVLAAVRPADRAAFAVR